MVETKKKIFKNKRIAVIFMFYIVTIILFTISYVHYWEEENSYHFKVDPEYKLNPFDLKKPESVTPLTDIMEYRKTTDELKESLENERATQMTEAKKELKLAEEKLAELWECHPQPGFQDGNCLIHNNGINTQIEQAKDKIALINLTYQTPIDLIDSELANKLRVEDIKRKKVLNRWDFALYSIFTSVGNPDPSIIANSSEIRTMNTIQFIVSLIFVSVILKWVTDKV